jgi:hypothetical protein
MARRNAKISTEGKPWASYLRLSKAEAAEDRGKTKEQRLALTNVKLDAHLARSPTGWMPTRSPTRPTMSTATRPCQPGARSAPT